MVTREELLKEKGYWLAKIQTELFRQINEFMMEKGMNQTELASYLGCSKGYVSQLLNGDFDHKLSKLVELSLAIGKVPVFSYQPINEYIESESKSFRTFMPIVFNSSFSSCSQAGENFYPKCA